MQGTQILDARGATCPGPLMELIAQIKLMDIGEEVEVLATDKGSATDIPIWLRKVGHELINMREDAGVYHIRVRKTK